MLQRLYPSSEHLHPKPGPTVHATPTIIIYIKQIELRMEGGKRESILKHITCGIKHYREQRFRKQ